MNLIQYMFFNIKFNYLILNNVYYIKYLNLIKCWNINILLNIEYFLNYNDPLKDTQIEI